MADVAGDALLGETVGSYRVAKLVGEGGMGAVYRAVHPTIGSRVALKVLSQECAANEEVVQRFFAEARAVNVIQHDNIVGVLDLATLPDGRPYILMELLDGGSIADVLDAHGQLPPEQAAEIAAQVLAGLGAAHEHDIIHRDIKPENIFLTRNGKAKLLDFGVAKLLPDLTKLDRATRTGAVMGTPHYMSPEQAQGLPVDGRSDLYAMGLVLFEMVTGMLAFDSTSLFDLFKQQVEEPPPPPRSLVPELPEAFELVILKALKKDPEQRFQAAEGFRCALLEAAGLPDAPAATTDMVSLAESVASMRRPPRNFAESPTVRDDTPARTHVGRPDRTPGPAARDDDGRRPGMSTAGIAIGAVGLLALGAAITLFVVRPGGGGNSASTTERAVDTAPSSATTSLATARPDAPDAAATPQGPELSLEAFLATCTTLAGANIPNPELVHFSALGVTRSGHFRPDGLMSNAACVMRSPLGRCWWVSVGAGGYTSHEITDRATCRKYPPLGQPKCQPSRAIAKALGGYETPKTTTGRIHLERQKGQRVWTVAMGNDAQATIPDDCR